MKKTYSYDKKSVGELEDEVFEAISIAITNLRDDRFGTSVIKDMKPTSLVIHYMARAATSVLITHEMGRGRGI